MKGWEAVKALDEGKKVRKAYWDKEYLYKEEDGHISGEEGGDWVLDGDWELL